MDHGSAAAINIYTEQHTSEWDVIVIEMPWKKESVKQREHGIGFSKMMVIPKRPFIAFVQWKLSMQTAFGLSALSFSLSRSHAFQMCMCSVWYKRPINNPKNAIRYYLNIRSMPTAPVLNVFPNAIVAPFWRANNSSTLIAFCKILSPQWKCTSNYKVYTICPLDWNIKKKVQQATLKAKKLLQTSLKTYQ